LGKFKEANNLKAFIFIHHPRLRAPRRVHAPTLLVKAYALALSQERSVLNMNFI